MRNKTHEGGPAGVTILISLSLILDQGGARCTHEYSLSVSHGDKELNRHVSHVSKVVTHRPGHLPSGPWLFLSWGQRGPAAVSQVPLDQSLPQLQCLEELAENRH